MEGEAWEKVLVNWVNCLKMCEPIQILTQLRNGDFLKKLRMIISKSSTKALHGDDLTAIFETLSSNYPHIQFDKKDSVHISDLSQEDLVNITSLLMHYTSVCDRKYILTSPMCSNLDMATQLCIKKFLESVNNQTTTAQLAQIIKSLFSGSAKSDSAEPISSMRLSWKSPLEDLVRTPPSKYVKFQQKKKVEALQQTLEAERADREVEVKKQEELVRKLTAQLEQKCSELKRLRVEMNDLDQSIPPKTQDLDLLHANKLLKTEVEALEQYVKKCEKESEEMYNENDSLKKKAKLLETECKNWEENFLDLEQNYLNSMIKSVKLEEENQQLQVNCSELKALLDEYRPKSADPYNDSTSCESRWSRDFDPSHLRETLADTVVDVRLREVQKTLDQVGEELREALEQNANLEKALDAFKTSSAALEAEMEQCRRETESLEAQLANAKEQTVLNNQKLEAALAKLDEKNFETESLKTQLVESSTNYERLREASADLEAQNGQLSSCLEDLTGKLDSFCVTTLQSNHDGKPEKQLDLLIKTLTSLEKERSILAQSLDGKEAELESFKTQWVESSSKTERLSVEVQALRLTSGDLEAQKGQLSNLLEDLTGKLDSFCLARGLISQPNHDNTRANQLNLLINTLTSLEKERSILAQSLDRKEAELESFKTQLVESSTKTERLSVEVQALRSTSGDLEAQKGQLSNLLEDLTGKLDSFCLARGLISQPNHDNTPANQLNLLINTLTSLEKERSILAQSLDGKEAELEGFKTQLVECSTKSERLSLEVQALRSTSGDLEAQRGQLSNLLEDLTGKLDSFCLARGLISQPNHDNTPANQLDLLINTLTSLEKERSILAQSLDRKEAELESFKTQLVECSTKSERLSLDVQALRSTSGDLEAQKGQLSSLLEDLTGKLDSFCLARGLISQPNHDNTPANQLNLLINTLTSLEKERSILAQSLDGKEAELESFKTQLVQCSTKSERLSLEVQALRSTSGDLEAQKGQLSSLLEDLTGKLDSFCLARGLISQPNHDNTPANQLNLLINTLTSLEKERSILAQSLDGKEAELESFKTQLVQCSTKSERLSLEVQALRSTSGDLEAQKGQLSSLLEDLTGKLDSFCLARGLISQPNHDNTPANQLNLLINTLTSLEKERSILAQSLDGKEAELESFKTQLVQCSTKSERLSLEVQALRSTSGDLEAQKGQLSNLLEDLTGKLDSFCLARGLISQPNHDNTPANQLDLLINTLTSLEKERSILAQSLDRKEAELESFKTQLVESSTKTERLSVEVQALRSTSGDLEAQKGQLSNLLEDLTCKLDSFCLARGLISQPNHDNTPANQLDLLINTLTSMEKERSILAQSLDGKEAELKSFKTQLVESSTKTERLSVEVQALRSTSGDLEAQKGQLSNLLEDLTGKLDSFCLARGLISQPNHDNTPANQLDLLINTLTSLEKERSILAQSLDGKEAELESFNTQLVENSAKTERLSVEVQALRSTSGDLEAQKGQLSNLLEDLTGKLDSFCLARGLISQPNHDNTPANQLDLLINTLTSLEKERSILAQSLDGKEAELESFKTQLVESSTKSERLSLEVQALRSTSGDLEAQKGQLSNLLEDLTGKLDSFCLARGLISQPNHDNTPTNQLDLLINTLTSLEKKLSILAQSLDGKEAELKSFKTQLVESSTKTERLSVEVQALRSTSDELEAQKGQLSNLLEDLTGKLDSFCLARGLILQPNHDNTPANQLDLVINTLTSLEKERSILAQSLDGKEAELESFKTKLVESSTKSERLSLEVQALRSTSGDLEAQKSQLSNLLEDLTGKLDSFCLAKGLNLQPNHDNTPTNQLDLLINTLTSLEKERSILAQSLDGKEAALESFETKLVESSTKSERLSLEAQALRSTSDELEAQKGQLSNLLEDLTGKLDSFCLARGLNLQPNHDNTPANQLDLLINTLTSLEKERSILAQSLDGKEAALESFETKLVESSTKSERLSLEVQALRSTSGDLEAQKSQLSNLLEDLTGKLDSFCLAKGLNLQPNHDNTPTNQLDLLINTLTSLEKERSILAQSLDGKEAALESFETKLVESSTKSERLSLEAQALRSTSDELEAQKGQLSNLLEDLTGKLDSFCLARGLISQPNHDNTPTNQLDLLINTLTSLEKERSILAQSLDGKEAELESFKTQLVESSTKSERLSLEVQALRSTSGDLEAQKGQLSSLLEDLTGKLDSFCLARGPISHPNNDNTPANQLDLLINTLTSLERERSILTKSLDETAERLKAAQQEKTVLTNFLELNGNELLKVTQEKDQILEALEMSNQDKLQLEEEHKQLGCKIASLLEFQEMASFCNSQLEQLQAAYQRECQERQKLLSDKSENLENLQKTIRDKEELFNELNDVYSQLEAAKKENQAMFSDYQDLQKTQRDLEVKMNNLQDRNQQLSESLGEAQTSSQALTTKLAEADSLCRSLKDAANEALKEKDDIYDFLQNAVQDKEQTALDRDRLLAENLVLGKERDALQAKLQDLNDEKRQLVLALELSQKETQKVKKERNEILQSQTEIIKQTEVSVMRAHGAAVDEKRQLLQRLEQAENDREKVRQAYSAVMVKKSNLELEISSLRYKVEEQKKELNQLAMNQDTYKKLLLEAQERRNKETASIKGAYEDKIDNMKKKMLELYEKQVLTEIQKIKADQAAEMANLQKTIDDLRAELFRAEQKVHQDQGVHASRNSVRSRTTESWREPSLRGRGNKVGDWSQIAGSSGSLAKQGTDRDPRMVRSTISLHDSSIREGKTATLPSRLRSEDATNHRASITSLGCPLKMEDEEDNAFSNKYLADLREGRCPDAGGKISNVNRVSELARRNTMVPPHLKSSYPAELQCVNPKRVRDEDVKSGFVHLYDSQSKLLPGEKPRQRKDFGTTSYKKPGPPTPSKNGGRASLQGNDVQPLREANSTPKKDTPSRIRTLFRGFRDRIRSPGENSENESPRRSKQMSIFRNGK